MSKRNLATLPPPTKYITREEIAARWRRSSITTQRLLRKFGVTVYRLTARDHLYAVAEIEAIEKKSATVAPRPARNYKALLASKQNGHKGIVNEA
jgi:hypothetical protein